LRASRNGICLAGNHETVHETKLRGEAFELFRQYNFLAQTSDGGLIGARTKSQGLFYYVDRTPAGLLLSLIADRIGAEDGMRTITNQDIPFLMNAFEKVNIRPGGKAKGILASTIINLEVPSVINQLDTKSYIQIRAKYRKLSTHFHEMISNLTQLHNLESISNAEVLQNKINRIALIIDEEMLRLKEDKSLKHQKWSVFSASQLLRMGAWALGPQGKIAIDGTRTVLDIIKETYSTRSNDLNTNAYRLLSSVNSTYKCPRRG
jgi:hypothetical protein